MEQAINDKVNIYSNYFLLGNGGTGKTFTLFLLWKKSVDTKEKHVIYVSLNEYNKWRKDNFLSMKISSNYFEDNIEEYKLFLKKSKDILDGHEIVVLLDGFDEILHNDKELILSEIKEFSNNQNICLIVTSRYDLQSYYGFANFSKLQILELSDRQIDSFLKKKNICPQKIAPNLRQIFTNPMMLLLYSESAEIIERDKNIKWIDFIIRSKEEQTIDFTIGEVLWNYFESYIAKVYNNKQDIKLAFYYKIVIFYCMPKLCWKLYENKQFEFTFDEFDNIISNIDLSSIEKRFSKMALFSDLNLKNEQKIISMINSKYIFNLVLNVLDIVSENKESVNSFLSQDQFIIKHHYFRDFFIALHVINEIIISTSVPDIFSSGLLPSFILNLVGNILGEHYNVPILKDGLWTLEHSKKTPLHKLLKGISNLDKVKANIALNNLLSIWKHARNGYIIGEVFENIDLSYCNLNNIIFYVKDNKKTLSSVFINVKNVIKINDFLTERHCGVINCLCFNSTFNFLASASTDCTIKIWKVIDNTLILYATFQGHTKPIKHLKFLKKSQELISCSIDGTIRKWNLENSKGEILLKLGTAIEFFDINEKENRILLSLYNSYIVKEYDIELKKIYEYNGRHSESIKMAIYISNDKILTSSSNGELFEWNTYTRDICYEFPKEDSSINCITFAYKSKKIFLCTSTGKIICYCDVKQERKRYETQSNLKSILFLGLNLEENKLISCGDDKEIHEWKIMQDSMDGKSEDMSNLIEISSIIGHGGTVNCAIYNDKSDKIYSGSWDNTIQIWESKTGLNLNKLDGTRNWINHLCFNKDQTKLLISCWNGDIQEWNVEEEKCIQIYHGHFNVVNKAIYNLDETKILSCSYDKTIREWDTNTGACIDVLNFHEDNVVDIKYSRDNKRIISCSFDNSIVEWHKDKNCSYSPVIIGKHSDYINGISFSCNENKILSWSDDGFVKEWDLNNNSYEEFDLKNALFDYSEIKYATYLNDKEILFISWYGVIGKISKIHGEINIIFHLNISDLQIQHVFYHKSTNTFYLCASNFNIYKYSYETNSIELFSRNDNLITSIAVSNCGEIYAAGWGEKIYYWENEMSIKKNKFSVLMGVYINNCSFNNCTFNDESDCVAIKSYNAQINCCKIK